MPFVLHPVRRGLRLAGLVATLWGMLAADPGPGTAGRGLVVLVLIVVASAAWLAWVVFPEYDAGAEPEPSRATSDLVVLGVLALGGGLLLGGSPGSAASAYCFVAVVAAGIRLELGAALVVLACAVGASLLGALLWWDTAVPALAYSGAFVAATMVGVNRRQFLQRVAQTERLLVETQRTQEQRIHNATLVERGRIAREIHDVLAHTLAGLTIQIEATRAMVERGAAGDVVVERLSRAHALARDGLVEARHAVGALRGDVLPLDAALSGLVTELEADGTVVALDCDPADGLPEAQALAIERTAREALTNVRKHAPGATVVVALRRGSDEVVLRVTDRTANRDEASDERTGGVSDDPSAEGRTGGGDPTQEATAGVAPELAASGGGYGVVGMRERATSLGGTLSAGPLPVADGGPGWRVELRLPLADGAPGVAGPDGTSA